jgi:hypothetical protein
VPYPLAGFSDQPHHAALGNAVPPTKLGGICSGHILGDEALDRVSRATAC